MEKLLHHGQYLIHMVTKVSNCEFKEEVIKKDFKRLTNQIWKLIPMKENGEDWERHLSNVIIEIAGLQSMFEDQLDFLILLSKLEGLKVQADIPFVLYRKTIFNSIELLNKLL